MSDIEKAQPDQASEVSAPAYLKEHSPERIALERRLVWKIDARMSILGASRLFISELCFRDHLYPQLRDARFPVACFVLIFAAVDRNNASAARSRGLTADLHLKGQEYPTLLSILYVGYILMQIPSNMLLNYIGKPSLYIPCGMIVWGMISALTGITTNFVGALLTRFFLGFVEAVFFPLVALCGLDCKLDEIFSAERSSCSPSGTQGVKSASALVFFTAAASLGKFPKPQTFRHALIASFSNAFGSLMASGILAGMNGKLGHAAWRWLFYIEGALTIFIAVVAIFVLPDFPTTSKWLSPEERELALLRMQEDVGVGDQGETETGGPLHGLMLAITDWKVWWLAFALTAQVIALSFNAFFPTLTATLGYNPTVTLLLCAPPFAFSALVTFFLARHSDKAAERSLHMIASFAVGIIGFVIAISTMNTAARYISLFMMAQSYAGFVILFAWINNSFPRPPSKRAVALALTNAFSQLGNIAGSYVWPSNWGPTYRNSYAITISCSGLSVVMVLIFREVLKRENQKLERKEEEEDVKTPGFRYVL
ncbi:FCP1-like proteiny domain-containing protein [Mycena chlorophos]|uniref:FCP1-like proteiny domain-containing protein n=1 Tax=Mycena chlorophos TaxID=658473 RepID=A0A8H6T9L6_MYCCL|nr:FCP1-like proteiny domain-containing protein [Mycena chlorophos]